MRRIKYKKVRKVVPNLFEYTGIHKTDPIGMQLFLYNEESYEELDPVDLHLLKQKIADPQWRNDVKWINIHGLHDTAFIQAVGDWLGLDSTNISDILNVTRRPKLEDLDGCLLFSIKSITPEATLDQLQVEQISFLLKDNLIVSFQEKKSDFFGHLRERIRSGAGIVRKKNNAYLLYLMLDAIMENFYITLEKIEDAIEKLITLSRNSQKRAILEEIERNREHLNFLKRSVVPLRDALNSLKAITPGDHALDLDSADMTYFNRLHQKSLEILDQIEYDSKAAESASNLYFASQTQRMNAIMKTLTIFSVIFMPLTFIVGVYGMNFKYMPELQQPNGYYIVLGIMSVIAFLMIWYFKKKEWF